MKFTTQTNFKNRLIDLVIIIILIFVSIFLAIFFNLNFLLTTLVFFGLPSFYLIIRKPSNLKKAMISATLFGILWGFSFDFIAEFNGAWSWSSGNSLIFPKLFLGVVSLDIMVWFFLWIFLVVAFYEYFVEYDFSKKISPNVKYSVIFGIITLLVIVTISKIDPVVLKIPYTYLVLGMLALGQFFFVVIRKPKLLPKLLEVVPFFIILYLSFELVALYLGLWSFPGQYVGMIDIQNLRFPFEEFFFWIIASSAVAVSYHELYVDDQK